MSVERGQVNDKLSRYRSLMKNKKQDKRNQSVVEDQEENNTKLGETDVKKIMEDHRVILQKKEEYGEYLGDHLKKEESNRKVSKRKKKKKVKDEDMVKMLYFKQYASKSKTNKRITQRIHGQETKVEEKGDQKKKIRNKKIIT